MVWFGLLISIHYKYSQPIATAWSHIKNKIIPNRGIRDVLEILTHTEQSVLEKSLFFFNFSFSCSDKSAFEPNILLQQIQIGSKIKYIWFFSFILRF